ncbi:MAG: 23S rRNA (guanosine(2251)-2'-O)-methyltransferase RlmB [Mariprofundaceae bacterium]
MSILAGIHAVKHALEAEGAVSELMIERGKGDGKESRGKKGGSKATRGKGHPRLNELIHLAKARAIRVSFQPRQALERLAEGVPHQGVVARIASGKRQSFAEWLNALDMSDKPLILLLDGVTDPHNLGACVRTAEAAGCGAVIVPKDHAASIDSPVAGKAACGALSRLPVLTVTNLVRAMKQLQDQGFWLSGLAGEVDVSLYEGGLNGAVGIVMGAEGKGLRRLVREQCDQLLSISLPGHVESLNVSVATGVALFEAVRQRAADNITDGR